MSFRFAIPNVPTKADYASTVQGDGSIPIINKPALKPVATSGLYNDLTGKPVLAAVATTGKFADLVDEPTLATVATSGIYNDLTAKPTTIATVTGAAGTLSCIGHAQNYSVQVVTLPTGAGAGFQFFNVQSQQVFIHGFYNAATDVTFSAADGANINIGNNGSGARTWDYIDPSKGFVPGNLRVVTNLPPGFWNVPGATYGTLTQSVNQGGSARVETINPIFLPAGRHEYRLCINSFVSINNSTAATPIFNHSNFFSSVPSTALTDSGTSGVQLQNQGLAMAGNCQINKRLYVGQHLAVNSPAVWRWIFPTTLNTTGGNVTTPPIANWTLQNGTGSANVMQSDGTIRIPATGVYVFSVNTYFGGTIGSQQEVRVLTNDGSIPYMIYAQAGPNVCVTGSWVGRLLVNTVLTPGFFSNGTAPNLMGINSDPRSLLHMELSQLYTCA